jgi:hypothetical protein
VPGATVTLAGEKFSVVSVPTFWGMTMVTEPPAGVEVAVVVLVEVGVLVVVLVVVLVEVGVIDDVVTEEDVVEVVVCADEEDVVTEDEDDAVEVLVGGRVAVLVELAVIVGLPAPFVVHHMVVHVDDEAEALVVVEAAELDAEWDADVVVVPVL